MIEEQELSRAGIITHAIDWNQSDYQSCMNEIICASEGLSGRSLRKLPFTAYSQWCCGRRVSGLEYLSALRNAVEREKKDREIFVK